MNEDLDNKDLDVNVEDMEVKAADLITPQKQGNNLIRQRRAEEKDEGVEVTEVAHATQKYKVKNKFEVVTESTNSNNSLFLCGPAPHTPRDGNNVNGNTAGSAQSKDSTDGMAGETSTSTADGNGNQSEGNSRDRDTSKFVSGGKEGFRHSAIAKFVEDLWPASSEVGRPGKKVLADEGLSNFVSSSMSIASSFLGFGDDSRRNSKSRHSGRTSRRQSMGTLEEKEFLEFQRRVTLAFRIQEASMVNTRLVAFQKTRIDKRWFNFILENGESDLDAESQFEREWWHMVTYWLKFIFTASVLSFAFATVLDIQNTSYLMSRIGARIFTLAGFVTFFFATNMMTISTRRRLLTFLVCVYFTMYVMTDVERVLEITTNVLGWYHCKVDENNERIYDPDFIDCTTRPCHSILPFLTCQLSMVSTFLRLPFWHMCVIVAYVSCLYVITGFTLNVSLFNETLGCLYELFCLFLSFGIMVLVARRIEVLSRYLFVRTKDQGLEEERSKWERDTVRVTGSGSRIQSGTMSGILDVARLQESMFSRLRLVIHGIAAAFTNKKGFMRFESFVIFGSGKMNMATITFYDQEMEFCYRLGRWEVSKKWSWISFCMVLFGLVCLSALDVQVERSDYCSPHVAGECNPDEYKLSRITPRLAFVIIAFIVTMLASKKIKPQIEATKQVNARYKWLVFIIVLYFTTIIMTEKMRLAKMLKNSIICSSKSCVCYSMLSFVTAQFSWVLVALRCPFNITMACLVLVSLIYIFSGLIVFEWTGTDYDPNKHNSIKVPLFSKRLGYEGVCLCLMCFCFTIASHRSDVLARAHFLLEYGKSSDDDLTQAVGKKLLNLGIKGPNPRAKVMMEKALLSSQSSAASKFSDEPAPNSTNHFSPSDIVSTMKLKQLVKELGDSSPTGSQNNNVNN